ncbi:MAG: hypothetical protein OHK0011_08450 [Turneriella sp.]
MLITSVSLPSTVAIVWRRRQKRILRLVPVALAQQAKRSKVRRGVKRSYNRGRGEYAIVTTQFSAEQYDTLHAAAAAMRVSVSLLIFRLILLWKQLRKRLAVSVRVTNYELIVHTWGGHGISYTENIDFGHPIKLPP